MASVAEMRMNSGVKGGHWGGGNQLILARGDMKEGNNSNISGDDGTLERNKEAEESSFARK